MKRLPTASVTVNNGELEIIWYYNKNLAITSSKNMLLACLKKKKKTLTDPKRHKIIKVLY